jgi:DnaK suppressor protein
VATIRAPENPGLRTGLSPAGSRARGNTVDSDGQTGQEFIVSKPPAKTAAKVASKVDAKAAPAAKKAAKAPAKPVTGHPVAKPQTKPTAPAKPAKVATSAKHPAPAAEVAAPAPNRFSDRFGPAKVMAPTHHVPMDPVKSTAKVDPKLANAWKTKSGRDLTEPELLAMPDSEYMNDKQIDYFRALLQVQKDDLLSNAGETTEHLREDTSIVPDPADRATIEEEHALELRTRDRERKLLKKISQALGRLETGEYGFCDETGEPIGLPRLLARPTATLSLEAQQRRELKQKMFGD